MPLSDWDRAHIPEILQGEGDWFTARLLRLIKAADSATRRRINAEFPDEVAAVEDAIGQSPGFMLGLTHLVQQADTQNRARLRRCFPKEVAAVERAYGLRSPTREHEEGDLQMDEEKDLGDGGLGTGHWLEQA